MTQQKAEVALEAEISEEEVAEYLRNHPDFFERHERLLLALRVPHASSRATVSLVERQVAVLRKRNDQLERQLKDLVAIAKQNDALVARIHKLALEFIRHPARDSILERLETALREDFSADRAMLVLYPRAIGGWRPDPEFAVVHERDSEALQAFSTFIRSGRTRCGRLRDRQKAVLFADGAHSLESAAMVPLGENGQLGFLVIANRDPDYFNPGKRTDFLNRLGELIAVALEQEREEEKQEQHLGG